jgi:sarcosine dehydrogenase
MWPLMMCRRSRRRAWLPTDGQASPSDITQSLAKGARMHGAKIVEGVRVTGFEMKDGRITGVRRRGRHRLREGGQLRRPVGAADRRMAGINVPLQPVKHQYIITEKIDGLSPTLPTMRDPDRRTYFKEEVGGLVMGGYEPNPQPWTTGDLPDDFEFQLFDDDWDHFEQHMMPGDRAFRRWRTGVKQMINGPESFTPDGNFILARPRNARTCSSAPASTPSASRRAAAPAGCWRNGSSTASADGSVGRRHPPLLRPAPGPAMGLRPHARSLWQALHDRLPA